MSTPKTPIGELSIAEHGRLYEEACRRGKEDALAGRAMAALEGNLAHFQTEYDDAYTAAPLELPDPNAS